MSPSRIHAGSSRRVWWKCPKGPDHIWRAPVVKRTREYTRCPFCFNQRLSVTNNLAALYPELARQWHPIRNGRLKPTNVIHGTLRKVWWKCKAGPDHEWQATVQHRTRGRTGCTYCSSRKLSVTNSFAAKHPRVAAWWHPRLNGKLTPDKVFSRAITPFWWLCDRGHEWKASPNSRVGKKGGCPICSRTRKQRQALTRRVREVVRFPGDLV